MGKSLILGLIFLCACEGKINTQMMDVLCANVEEQVLVNNSNKNYTLLATNDDLDDNDLDIFNVGLNCLGYTTAVIDKELTHTSVVKYNKLNYDFLYFTGHGQPNVIYIEDEEFGLTPAAMFAAKIIFLATCSSLQDSDRIRLIMNKDTRYLLGYTNKSFDYEDEIVVYNLLENVKQGYSIPLSFYNANKENSALHDRWVIYKRVSRDVIVEYSERNGNRFYEE